MKNDRLFLLLTFLSFSLAIYPQNDAYVTGVVTDEENQPVSFVNIHIENYTLGAITDKNGLFSIKVPSGQNINIIFSYVGFETKTLNFSLESNQILKISVFLKRSNIILEDVEIKAQQNRTSTLIRLNPKINTFVPNISGSTESIIKTLPGVSSNNEMSTQYSVRGGNFDENIVYVNGIEIYRPFLIRSGQQEGLSFLNSDLISSISFSAGGFEAKYGEKMSSVLDITYKNPQTFNASVSLGLLGSNAHIEDISKNHKFSILIGIRYKTNKNLLNSLDIQGDYQPFFNDFQALFSYKLSDKLNISFLTNFANNTYNFIPSNRTTSFGTLNNTYQLKIYFEGAEIDRFQTFFGAFTTSYKFSKNIHLQFIASTYQTIESETYDIQGQYWINRLDPSNDKLNQISEIEGVGTHINHARNYLDATVISIEHKGVKNSINKILEWGIKFKQELFNDKLNEWEMVDSASYSLPNPISLPGNPNPDPSDFVLHNTLKSKSVLKSNRLAIYAQHKYIFNPFFALVTGLRLNYWDFNQELLLSPRIHFSYKPEWEKDILFRFSTGLYYQSPFYKELRDLKGNILNMVKSQKSIHFVAGLDWNLRLWNRPFLFVTEMYYKHLEDLIPYKIDNVRIRYLPHLSSKGYATGIDFKINGEFVPGTESWASLSLMKTEEDIVGDFYFENYNAAGELIIPGITEDDVIVSQIKKEPGYISRPTDQFLNFSILFQDYLPHNPSYRVHLRLVYGSRLTFGPPDAEKYMDVLRIPPYRRIDIGFTKHLIEKTPIVKNEKKFRHFKTLWLTVEILNLLQINNTISYLWIKDIHNTQYAIPNYLSGRQLNFKIIATF